MAYLGLGAVHEARTGVGLDIALAAGFFVLAGYTLTCDPRQALTLVAASGTVSAQQVGALHVQPSTGGYSSQGGQYDYARVVRVDPVIDSGRYGSNDYASGDRRCYQRQDHARGSVYDGGYSDGYGRDDYYRGNDG